MSTTKGTRGGKRPGAGRPRVEQHLLQVRLTPVLWERLCALAEAARSTVSDVVRGWIEKG